MWSVTERRLYWVDIKAPALHRLDPETGLAHCWTLPELVGCIIEDGPGQFIAAFQSGFVRLDARDDNAVGIIPLADPEAGLPGNRFNDGKRAPDGSIWAGTMDNAEKCASGAWWRWAEGEALRRVDPDTYKITNGPAFDVDRNRVYLTDSATQTVYVADLVDGGAAIADKRIFIQFGDGDGYPDGMTVGPDGCVWIAFWGGGCIRRITPEGGVAQRIDMPVSRPTSLAFDDSERRVFVTSASIGLSGEALAGGVFRLDLLNAV